MAKVLLHEYISNQLDVCGRTQREIAADIGYKNPNIITMFKQARTKVPLDKIGPFARAIGVDPVNMLRIAMLEYMPDTWKAIEDIVGNAVTENEFEMVEVIRDNVTTPHSDPKMRTQEQRLQLQKFAQSL